jgi:RimJ/RimL family protein N-acetyltransferase
MAALFKPLTADDLPMLHEWIHRSHVRRWWGEPPTLAELQTEYLPTRCEASCPRAYVAMLEGKPIGFIQCYVVKDSDDGWWEHETDPGARGIDQFVADETQLGQGIGSTVVQAFVEKLFEDPSVTSVQVDPSPENRRAIRCYSRAGFAVIGTVDTPDGPALLMRIDRRARVTPGSNAVSGERP